MSADAGAPAREGRRAGALGLTLLLAWLSALAPLSTDMYLASLPDMTVVLATGIDRVQLTLSVYLTGFAASQLAWGPLADRFGRRPVLFAGLLLYTIASAACALAPSIDGLIAARLLQSVGACAGPVVALAIVRDLQGDDPGAREGAARMLGQIASVRALAPAVAPILGGLLHEAFGWRASFVALTAFGLSALGAVVFLLRETLAHPDPGATAPRRLAANARAIVGDRRWLGYALAASFSYAGLFAFISGSSFVLIQVFGVTPGQFGFFFALGVIGYITGTQTGARLVHRVGVDRLLKGGSATLAAAGLAMLGATLAGIGGVGGVMAPVVVYMVGFGIVLPQTMAGAVSPFPRMAGTASALLGCLQMSFAALVGVIVAHLYSGTALAMAATIGLMGALTLGSVLLLVGRRRRA